MRMDMCVRVRRGLVLAGLLLGGIVALSAAATVVSSTLAFAQAQVRSAGTARTAARSTFAALAASCAAKSLKMGPRFSA